MRRGYLPFLFIFLLFGLSAASLRAQTPLGTVKQDQNGNGSWDDEDDEADEETEKKFVGEKFDEALIFINDSEIPAGDSYEMARDQVLQIRIQHLLPHSFLGVHLEKGGAAIDKQRFQANEKGELELEVRTGKHKVSGTAKVYYHPSNGIRRDRTIRIRVI